MSEINTYNGNAYKKLVIIHRHNLIFQSWKLEFQL